jgi:hypothetical protein
MRGFGDYESCDTASAIKARDHKDATDLVIQPPILIDRAAFNQGINAQYNTHISDDPVSPSLVARGPHAVATNDPVLMRQREGKPGGGKGPLLSNDKSLTFAGSNDQTLFTPVQEPMLIDGTRVDDVRIYEPPVQTLKTRMGTGGNNVPVIGFIHTQGLSAQPSEAAWPTLRTEGNGMAVAIPIQDGRDMDHQQNGLGIGAEGAPSYTILATGGQSVAYGLQGNGMAVAYDEYNDTIGADVHHALRAGTKQSTGVMTTMAVRRLTPLECERLMGWPDGWTATKADGTPQSDTHRYKQCGNGIASPVAQWIAQQLLQLDKEPDAPPTTTTT